MSKKSAPRVCRELKTPFPTSDNKPDWRSVYPRPQMQRESFFSLCGKWELSVKKNESVSSVGTIEVPFAPESCLSNIMRTLSPDETYIYCRTFTLPSDFNRGRILLHFGAVDQIATVSLNGTPLAVHEGGYLPFTVELTDSITSGENTLTVEVTDTLDTDLPYGKQSRKRGGMWYTPVSGIWQPVWIESVPKNYIEHIRISCDLVSVTIESTGGEAEKKLTIETPSGVISRTYSEDRITVPIPDPIHWSPDTPHLYPFTLTAGKDTVTSYFALRTVSIEKHKGQSYICLNGTPVFFHGLLDQGYFSDGIYTPATPEGHEFDILTMKKLGFNMLRKHIKIEPEMFYYYCDKYGMFVFQDMVNSGTYNFLIDTALPTIGLKKGITHFASKRRRDAFESAAKETVRHLFNHPSVVYYTIFNEGWGQYDADKLYTELKSLDPNRIWDATSGWFFEKRSDVQSEHIYFKKVDLKPQPDRPLILSEFGGYVYKVPDHSFNPDNTYGYKLFDTSDALAAGFETLYLNEIIPMIDRGLNAAVMTQLSDVEDETNGMVTYDRQVVKVGEMPMRAIADALYDRFRKHIL